MIKQLKLAAVAISCAFVWAGLAAFAAGAARPSDSPKSTAKAKTTVTNKMSDADFAKAAAEGGLAEVKFGELAEDKASSKTVKDLSQRMVDDHTRADDSLKTAASKENLSIPAQMSAKDQAAYAHLSELSGAAFDRAYARDMVRDHEADIATFRREANDGKDASIKSFASQTLPTLEDHLKMARQALESVSPKTSAKTTKKQS
jgi:putative membrane protein